MSRRNEAVHTHTHTLHCIIHFSHRQTLSPARTVNFYTTRVSVCAGKKQINIKHYYYRFADGNVLGPTAADQCRTNYKTTASKPETAGTILLYVCIIL